MIFKECHEGQKKFSLEFTGNLIFIEATAKIEKESPWQQILSVFIMFSFLSQKSLISQHDDL